MSHYRSGRYYVELNKRQAIESACQERLRQAQQERDAAAEYRRNIHGIMAAEERQRNAQALEDAAQARDALSAARQERADRDARARAIMEQVDADIKRLLVVFRDDPATADLALRREQLWQMYHLEGSQNEFIEQAVTFLNVQLPQWKQTLEQKTQERITRSSVALVNPVTVSGEDRSEQFVSLQGAGQRKQQTGRRTPWDDFCARVEELLARQKDMASEELLLLAEQIQNIAPAKQKLFLVQNLNLLKQLEEEAADIAEVVDQGDAAHAEQLRKYEALCGLLQHPVDPQLQERSYPWLAAENERLWRLYLLQEEEAYVDRNLQEVFDQFGIRFDNLETVGSEDGSVQMQCDLPNSTRLTMKKNSGGAFSMEFTGVSASSTVSMDERRRVAAEAQSFCSMMPQITAELKRRGILIQSSYQEEPTAETVRIEQGTVRSGVYTKKKERTMK